MSENDIEPEHRYDTVDSLRRSLMEQHRQWQQGCMTMMKSHEGKEASDVEKMAVAGSMMAANYSYTLAAVLGVIQSRGPQELADFVARIADEVMTDGDFADLNADLKG